MGKEGQGSVIGIERGKKKKRERCFFHFYPPKKEHLPISPSPWTRVVLEIMAEASRINTTQPTATTPHTTHPNTRSGKVCPFQLSRTESWDNFHFAESASARCLRIPTELPSCIPPLLVGNAEKKREEEEEEFKRDLGVCRERERARKKRKYRAS